MEYKVNIKETKTNKLIKTMLTTNNFIEASTIINEYNKEYGIFKEIGEEYPKDKYFIDVYNEEVI